MTVDVHLGDAEGLDRQRRYLRPVAEYDTGEVHLSVYRWLPQFEAWVTGSGLCGRSMRQGPLPDGTPVSCEDCEGWRPRYERMLAPGYDPADDDPEKLRAKLDRIREQVSLLCECCGTNRERMAYLKQELGLEMEVGG